MNQQATVADVMSVSSYAKTILGTFDTPIAIDRMDAMLYMTVGAGRLRLLRQLTARMHSHLLVGQSRAGRGMFFEGVLGDFGCGKSHIGYMLKHNAYTCGEELLVSHVQITGDPRFPAILAAILRGLRVAGVPSVMSQDVEISAYRKLVEWTGNNAVALHRLVRQSLGNIAESAAHDFVQAVRATVGTQGDAVLLRRFFDAWINRSDAKTALECFEMVFRVFCALKSNRCVFIVDEFEAAQALEEHEQRQMLQALQDLHDDFAGRKPGLPGTYLVCLSTADWWGRGGAILPSLLGDRQRVKQVSAIPNIEKVDVAALVYRYVGLYHLAYDDLPEVTSESIEQACVAVWAEIAGMAHHMRTVHAAVGKSVSNLLQV